MSFSPLAGEFAPGGRGRTGYRGRVQPYRALLPGARYLALDLRSTPLVDVDRQCGTNSVSRSGIRPGLVHSNAGICARPGPCTLRDSPRAQARRQAVAECSGHVPARRRRRPMAFSACWVCDSCCLLLREVELVPEGGSIAGFFRTINVGVHLLARYSLLRSVLSYTVIPVFNLVGLGLEEMVRSRNQAFTVNYSAMARK